MAPWGLGLSLGVEAPPRRPFYPHSGPPGCPWAVTRGIAPIWAAASVDQRINRCIRRGAGRNSAWRGHVPASRREQGLTLHPFTNIEGFKDGCACNCRQKGQLPIPIGDPLDPFGERALMHLPSGDAVEHTAFAIDHVREHESRHHRAPASLAEKGRLRAGRVANDRHPPARPTLEPDNLEPVAST